MTALRASTAVKQPSVQIRRRDIKISHVRTDDETSGARSYLGDGRRVSWSPPRPAGVLIAVDAERALQPVPQSLGRRFGHADPLEFWRLWTTSEVAAKLLDVPILLWITRYGLGKRVSGVTTRTLLIDTVVVSCGWCHADTRTRRRG